MVHCLYVLVWNLNYDRWHAYDQAVPTQIGQYLLHGSDSLVALMWPQQRGGVGKVSP
jgi:hypothetical protein